MRVWSIKEAMHGSGVHDHTETSTLAMDFELFYALCYAEKSTDWMIAQTASRWELLDSPCSMEKKLDFSLFHLSQSDREHNQFDLRKDMKEG